MPDGNHIKGSLPDLPERNAGQRRLWGRHRRRKPIFHLRSLHAKEEVPAAPQIVIPDMSKLQAEELPDVGEDERLILAPSKKIVMEWSLVLTSQHIESTILFPHQHRWFLMVNAQVHTRSLEIIHLYLVENRNWNWTGEFSFEGKLFNWGALYWVIPIGIVYLLDSATHNALRAQGMMDSDSVLHEGQWWRVFTSTFLHGDIGHLASNLSLGFPLFGLAMARYGIGWTLLATLLAGVCGNLLSLLIHPTNYASLGASGVVMGVLGLLSVYVLPLIRRGTLPGRFVFSALAASMLIFILTGLSPEPEINIMAHLGGFLGGILLGFILSCVPNHRLHHQFTNVMLTIFWYFFVGLCWRLAIENLAAS